MTLQEVIAGVVAIGLLVGGICVIWAIIRFSFVSERRTRGWQIRLRKPRMHEVEAKWNIRLPQVLESFFQSNVADRSEFYFAPAGSDQAKQWYIEHFIPLTARDITE